jgi:hypothetical protein
VTLSLLVARSRSRLFSVQHFSMSTSSLIGSFLEMASLTPLSSRYCYFPSHLISKYFVLGREHTPNHGLSQFLHTAFHHHWKSAVQNFESCIFILQYRNYRFAGEFGARCIGIRQKGIDSLRVCKTDQSFVDSLASMSSTVLTSWKMTLS